MLHEYPRDFYGQHLKVIVLGFVRPEYNYSSLGRSPRSVWSVGSLLKVVITIAEALIDDIETDKKCAFTSLDRPAYQTYQSSPFWTEQS